MNFQTGTHTLEQDHTECNISGKVQLLDTTPISRNITVEEGAELLYCSAISDSSDVRIIFTVKEGGILRIRGGCFGKMNTTIKAAISIQVIGSHTTVDAKLLAFVFDAGNIMIDGVLEIHPGCTGVDGSLVEKNMFLGETGSIRGLPVLKVDSDDVRASHSCTVERLSEDVKFYVETRGLHPSLARELLLSGRIMDFYIEAPDYFGENLLQTLSF